MSSRPPAHRVRFGVFEFDPASGDLWKAGRRVRLQRQPRQVLTVLLSRPGELVSRDELRRLLWRDDTFVDFDNGLNVAVRKIRNALGDATLSPRFVETERALGYRFIAPVTDGAPEPRPEGPPVSSTAAPGRQDDVRSPGPEPGIDLPLADRLSGRRESWRRPETWTPRPWFVLAALLLGAVALVIHWPTGVTPGAKRSAPPHATAPIDVAVLPFSTQPPGREDFLAVGIPDGIITRLSNVTQVRVRPTSAVARYYGREFVVQEVGRRLGVQYALVGTVRPLADRVRVSVQLLRTIDESPVWGGQYDVARGDLLGIEDKVADEISRMLRVKVSGAERERMYRRHTRNGAAYERYLMGRARLRSVTEQDALRAIAEFEAARDLDPGYALAYAGLATAAAQLHVRFGLEQGSRIWTARARQEAGRALQLDPDLAEAHVAIAAVHRFQEYDWDTVIRESHSALALNPSLDAPHLYLAVAYFHLGLLEEADSEVSAARQLNPENRVEPLEILGAVNLFAGRVDDASNYLSQVHALTDSRIVGYLLGWTLYYQGEHARAEALLESLGADDGPLPGNARATLAAIRAARGATSEARALAGRVAVEPDLIHHGAYGLGTAYAQLREPDAAVRWLSQAAATGFSCYPWYERDPLLDPIRDDARFAAFMRDLHRSWESARAKYARDAAVSDSTQGR